MKLRVLGTLTVLTLFLVLVQVSADPPDKPSPTDPKTPTDVSSFDIGVRVLATLKDSEQKEHSRDLAKYAKDPSAVDDVLLFKATAKTPMSRYRLHHLDLQSGGRCYYGIDLYAKGDARLLEMTGGAGGRRLEKAGPRRQPRNRVHGGAGRCGSLDPRHRRTDRGAGPLCARKRRSRSAGAQQGQGRRREGSPRTLSTVLPERAGQSAIRRSQRLLEVVCPIQRVMRAK